MKNLTYLFLVYKNASFVRHTFDRLNGENVQFYVHVDGNSKEDFSCLKELPNVTFSSKRINCAWGGGEIVLAIANSLKEIAEKISTDYVILMSESDYPVKSSEYIQNFFNSTDKDYAIIKKFPVPGWIEGGMRRIKCYAVRFGNKGIATIEPRALNWENLRQFGKLLLQAPAKLPEAIRCLFKPQRSWPEGIQWCGGELWFSLRINTVQKIVKYLETDDRILKGSMISSTMDEVVYPSLVYAFSPASERVNSILRYVNWPAGKSKSPDYFSLAQADTINNLIEDKGTLFIRKVQSFEVAEYIDKRLQSNE